MRSRAFPHLTWQEWAVWSWLFPVLAKNDSSFPHVYTWGISSECFSQLGPLIIKFLYIKHQFGMNLDAMSLLFAVLFLLHIYPTIPYDLAPLYLVLLSCGNPQLQSFSVIPADTFGHFSVAFLSAALLPPSLWPACTRKQITHGKRSAQVQNWSWQWSPPKEQQPLTTLAINNTHHLGGNNDAKLVTASNRNQQPTEFRKTETIRVYKMEIQP